MNAKVAILLKQEAQRAFEKRFPGLDFREIFGKNYLDTEEDTSRQQALQGAAAAAGQGMQDIEGVSGMGTEWR